MPYRTAVAARDVLLTRLQRAVSCVSNVVLQHNCSRPQAGMVYFVAAPGGRDIRVPTTPSEHVRLQLEWMFRIDALGEARQWEARIEKYGYQLLTDDGAEMLAYHFHPGELGFDPPHLHVSSGAGSLRAEFHRAHLPTGTISLEDFLSLVIREFRVRPQRADYRAVLAVMD